jgi:hypothetical protein
LPKDFRFYYHEADQAIVTMDPDSAEQAYEQFCLLRAQRFQAELNVPKALEGGATLQLTDVRARRRICGRCGDFPSGHGCLPDLSARSVVQPLPEQTFAQRRYPGVDRYAPEDVNHSTPDPYWILQVQIDPQGQMLTLEDLEFCIAEDDVLVGYPLHGRYGSD